MATRVRLRHSCVSFTWPLVPAPLNWVHGWQVAPPGDFTLGMDIVQGHDLTISGAPSGPVPANTPITLHVTYAKATLVSGQSYKGELLLGPSVAPTAVSVPVTITRN